MGMLLSLRALADIYLGIIRMREKLCYENCKKKIDETQYWDLEILDFQINFFGDEVNIFIYDDINTSWKISFLTCYKVTYETDANWRTIAHVRDMKKSQLGYYGQDITISESKDFNGFYKASIDLTILTAEIVFKEIVVVKV